MAVVLIQRRRWYHNAMTDTLEVRIAHLEGAYEQVDKRLGGVESVLIQLRSDLNSFTIQFRADLNSSVNELRAELTARMDGQFHWLLGTILTSWITLLGLLLAIFFRR